MKLLKTIKKTDDFIVSETNILNTSSISEMNMNEGEADNWQLGLVFYDSTINNGRTPLTEFSWDASDGGREQGQIRTITFQVNYKNTNCTKTYQPGELQIELNLYGLYNLAINNNLYIMINAISANNGANTGYDWNIVNERGDFIVVENNIVFEKDSSFEGNIQIVCNVSSGEEPDTMIGLDRDENGRFNRYVEDYEDECTHTFDYVIKAKLRNIIESNEIPFHYTRTYIHPWKEVKYTIYKNLKKIEGYDGLSENAEEYIWVQHEIRFNMNKENPDMQFSNGTFNIFCDDIFAKFSLPEECIIYHNGKQLEENKLALNYYIENYGKTEAVFIGYPKSKYEDIIVDNSIELYGTYRNKTESELLNSNSYSLNLSEFKFEYDENGLYSIFSHPYSYYYDYYRILKYQFIINDDEYSLQNYSQNGYGVHKYREAVFFTEVNITYINKPLTVKLGTDLLYATNKNGNYEKLKDDEFYFTEISFLANNFLNSTKQKIEAEKYDCELWVRYKDADGYILYESFKNPENNIFWDFTKEDEIVAYYFE